MLIRIRNGVVPRFTGSGGPQWDMALGWQDDELSGELFPSFPRKRESIFLFFNRAKAAGFPLSRE
jgi:hypothetical protein